MSAAQLRLERRALLQVLDGLASLVLLVLLQGRDNLRLGRVMILREQVALLHSHELNAARRNRDEDRPWRRRRIFAQLCHLHLRVREDAFDDAKSVVALLLAAVSVVAEGELERRHLRLCADSADRGSRSLLVADRSTS